MNLSIKPHIEPLSLNDISQKVSTPKNQYIVEFPSGPMGLELEPVITSSEREVGCRVKDYYFGLDHYGIDPEYINNTVKIGDIICRVQGKDVLSAKFKDILEMLRTLKDVNRTVIFKEMNTNEESQTFHFLSPRTTPRKDTATTTATTAAITASSTNTTITSLTSTTTTATASGTTTSQPLLASSSTSMKADTKATATAAGPGSKSHKSVGFTSSTADVHHDSQQYGTQQYKSSSSTEKRFVDKVLSPSLNRSQSQSNTQYTSIPSTPQQQHHQQHKQNRQESPLRSMLIIRDKDTNTSNNNNSSNGNNNNNSWQQQMTMSPQAVRNLTKSPGSGRSRSKSSPGDQLLLSPLVGTRRTVSGSGGTVSGGGTSESTPLTTERSTMISSARFSSNSNSSEKSVADSSIYSTDDVTSYKSSLILSHKQTNKTKQLQHLLSTESLFSPEIGRFLGIVGQSLGQTALAVGSVVTHQAADVAIAVGSSMGDQTESLVTSVADSLPKYSELEVKQMMSKKDNLLNELSRVCLELGVAEENLDELEMRTKSLQQHEESLADENMALKIEINELKAEIDSLQNNQYQYQQQFQEYFQQQLQQQLQEQLTAQKQHLHSQYQQQHNNDKEDMQLQMNALSTSLIEWQQVAEDHKQKTAHLQEQLAISENQLNKTKHDYDSLQYQYEHDTNIHNETITQLKSQQHEISAEIKLAMHQALDELNTSNQLKDSYSVEIEFLKDCLQSEKHNHMHQHDTDQRYLQTQQETYQQRLTEYENKVFQSNQEILRFQELSGKYDLLVSQNTDLSKQIIDLKSEYMNFQTKYHELESLKYKLETENHQAQLIIQSLSKQNDDYKNDYKQLQSVHMNKIEELQIENRVQSIKVSEYEQKVSQLSSALTSSQQQIQTLQQHNIEIESSNNTMITTSNININALTDAKKQIEILQKQLEEKSQECSLANKNNLDLTHALEDAVTKSTDIVNRTKLALATREEEFRLQLSEWNDEKQRMTVQMRQLSATAAASLTTLTALTSATESTSAAGGGESRTPAQSTALALTATAQETVSTSTSGTLSPLLTLTHTTEHSPSHATAALITKLTNESSSQQSQLREMRHTIDSLHQLLVHSKDDYMKLLTNNHTLQLNFDNQSQRYHVLEKDMNEYKQNATEQINQLQAYCDDKSRINASLQIQINENEHKMDEMRTQNIENGQKMDEILNNGQQELSQLKLQYEHLELQLSTAIDRANIAESKLNEVDNLLADLTASNETSTSVIESTQSESLKQSQTIQQLTQQLTLQITEANESNSVQLQHEQQQQQQVIKMLEENMVLQSTNISLEQSCLLLQQQIQQHKADTCRLQDTIDTLKLEVSDTCRLENLVSEYQSDTCRLQEMIDTLKQELSDTQTRLTESDTKHSDHIVQLTSQLQNQYTLQQQQQQQQSQSLNKAHENDSQQQLLLQQQQQSQQQQEQQITLLKAQSMEKESKNYLLQSELISYKDRHVSTEKMLKESQKRYLQLNHDMKTNYELRISELTTKLDEITAAYLKDRQSLITSYETRIKEYKRNIMEFSTNSHKLQSQLIHNEKTYRNDMKQLEGDNATLITQLNHIKAQYEELQKLHQQSENNHHANKESIMITFNQEKEQLQLSYNQQLSTLNNALTDTQTSLQATVNNYNNLQSMYTDIQSSYQLLENNLKSSQQIIIQLNQDQEHSLRDKEHSLLDKEHSSQLISEQKQKIIHLQASNNNITSELATIQSTHTQLITEKEQLQKQFFDIQSRYQLLLSDRTNMSKSVADELNIIINDMSQESIHDKNVITQYELKYHTLIADYHILQAKYEHETSQLQHSKQSELAYSRTQHATELNEIKHEYEEKLRYMQQLLETQHKEHKERVQILTLTHQQQLQQSQSQLQQYDRHSMSGSGSSSSNTRSVFGNSPVRLTHNNTTGNGNTTSYNNNNSNTSSSSNTNCSSNSHSLTKSPSGKSPTHTHTSATATPAHTPKHTTTSQVLSPSLSPQQAVAVSLTAAAAVYESELIRLKTDLAQLRMELIHTKQQQAQHAQVQSQVQSQVQVQSEVFNSPTRTHSHSRSTLNSSSHSTAVNTSQQQLQQQEQDQASHQAALTHLHSQLASLTDSNQLLTTENQLFQKRQNELLQVINAQMTTLQQAQLSEYDHLTTQHRYEELRLNNEKIIKDNQLIIQQYESRSNEIKLENHSLNTQIINLNNLIHNKDVMMAKYKREKEKEDEEVKVEVQVLRNQLMETKRQLQDANHMIRAHKVPGEEERLIQSSQRIRSKERGVAWLDRLMTLVLDLHEALTVALFDASQAQTQAQQYDSHSLSGSGSGNNSSSISGRGIKNGGGGGGSSSSSINTSTITHSAKELTAQLIDRWRVVSEGVHQVHLHAVNAAPWLEAVDATAFDDILPPHRILQQYHSISDSPTQRQQQLMPSTSSGAATAAAAAGHNGTATTGGDNGTGKGTNNAVAAAVVKEWRSGHSYSYPQQYEHTSAVSHPIAEGALTGQSLSEQATLSGTRYRYDNVSVRTSNSNDNNRLLSPTRHSYTSQTSGASHSSQASGASTHSSGKSPAGTVTDRLSSYYVGDESFMNDQSMLSADGDGDISD